VAKRERVGQATIIADTDVQEEALNELSEDDKRRIALFPVVLRTAMATGSVVVSPARLDGRRVLVLGVTDEPNVQPDENGEIASRPLMILSTKNIEDLLEFDN